MKRQNIYILTLLAIIFPLISHAQVGIEALLIESRSVLQLLPRFIFGLATIYFFWGTGQFILNAGDAKLRQDGKNKMIWGVVVLTVFISISGILNLMSQLLN
ncbi:MAG: hypothetical protein AB198_00735 [Parcubacteria bacterium C7867-003]|nr:MAG: hypothetical protein AB198_00735 [Parcubacteria bacterium C7867-003]